MSYESSDAPVVPPGPENECPLCARTFLREELHDLIASEEERLRESTILVIQAYHPNWTVEQGACGPCWRSYREAGRILSLLKQNRRHQNCDYWSENSEPTAGWGSTQNSHRR